MSRVPVDTGSWNFAAIQESNVLECQSTFSMSFLMLFIIVSGGVLNFCEGMLFVAWIYWDQWAKPISESFGFYYLVPVVTEFFIVFFSSLSDPQPKQNCLGYFITVGTYLFDLQSGLVSAYIIKTMYFGRYTCCFICWKGHTPSILVIELFVTFSLWYKTIEHFYFQW